MDDTQIIDLYWDRDQGAITATAGKYGSFLHALSWNILRSHHDAEECVNDTYFRAWNAMPPERPSALRAWLGRITRNLSLDRWKAGRTQSRGAGMETLLGELDDAGFFLAPDESVTQLTERLSALADGLSLLPEEPLLMKLTADAAEVSGTLRDRAYELTSQKFRFRMKWIPVWYSSRQTGIFSAGVLLEIDQILPLVFLNNAFSGKGKYMGYDAAETLAHEMIHAARIAFPASAYEEYFSCHVNRSAFRRAVGNLFRRW